MRKLPAIAAALIVCAAPTLAEAHQWAVIATRIPRRRVRWPPIRAACTCRASGQSGPIQICPS